MHDIKWIRENPDAFDRALDAARACRREAKRLIAIDERRRAAIQKRRGGAGAAQRGLEGDRRGQEEQRRGARARR